MVNLVNCYVQFMHNKHAQGHHFSWHVVYRAEQYSGHMQQFMYRTVMELLHCLKERIQACYAPQQTASVELFTVQLHDCLTGIFASVVVVFQNEKKENILIYILIV